MTKPQLSKQASSSRHLDSQKATGNSNSLRTAIERKDDDFLRLAMDVAELGFWEWGVASNRLVWGGGLERIFGVEAGEFSGDYDVFLKLVHPDDRAAVQQEIALCLVKGEPCHLEFRNLRPDGSVHWLAAEGRPLWSDAGRISRVIGLVRDVTCRKVMEQRLLESAVHVDKEKLLKAAYRLVNPGAASTHECALEMHQFSDSSGQGVATTLNQNLTKPGDLGRVCMAMFINNLVEAFCQTDQVRSGAIRIDLDVENIYCATNVASACGQIVHELVSNALQHGFPNGREGEIRVQLMQNSDETATLLVGDNGVGLLNEVDFTEASSLGLALVSDQVRQIGGTIALDRTWGSVISITFAHKTSETSPQSMPVAEACAQ